MTPEERQMISDLFDRMRGVSVDKDRDAEALISQRTRSTPDAAYLLVQSVLMQEFALQQSTARIEELEEQVRQMEASSQPPQRNSGGFLGGLFGGSRPSAPASSSVPAFGSRPAASPWGNQGNSGYSAARGPAPMERAPMAPPPAAAAPSSGGFLKGAMAAAAGVAGGMLLAESVRNMMSSSPASASTTGSGHDDNDPAGKSYGGSDTSYVDNDPANDRADDGWDSGNGSDVDL